MTTIAEVREKFPQYNDMSDADLAGALHQKFYTDMPLAEFHDKIGFTAPDPLNVNAPPDRGLLGGINNFVGGTADAATQGLTFGFADELGAGGRALARGATNLIQGKDADLSGNYDRALADIRGREKQFAEEHPVASTTANIVGGLATGGPAAKAVVAAPSIPRAIGTAATTGAGYGALGGFGAGEGGFENRIASAGQGAALGGLFGGALPAVGAVGNQIVGKGINLFGLNNPRNTALDQLNRALVRDETTPGAVQSTLSGTTKPYGIVDSAGDSATRLGRVVETIPGKGSNQAKQFLNERQADQVDRVTEDITTHLSPGNFHQTLDDLDRTRRATAAPLYDEAYAQPLVWNATIETLLDRPSTRSALKRAHGIAAEEGRDPTGLGLDLDADGNVKINKTAANMQTLDYVKRGLDDVVEQFRDTTTGKLVLDESGKAINQTRARFVKSVDAINPKYAEARAAWGGPTQTMEAARLGRQYASGDAEVTLERFRRLSPGDQDAFRLGVARELAGKVENTRDTHNAVPRIFGSKGQRTRLRALFPDQGSFDAFEKGMNEEIRMAQTRQAVTGNSVTSRINAEQEDAGNLANVAVDYVNGGAGGATLGLFNRAMNRTRGLNEATTEQLSQMLFTSDRAVQAQVLAELQRRQAQVEQRARAGMGLLGAGTAGTANLIGQGLATNE
jgi:hypothetical protein